MGIFSIEKPTALSVGFSDQLSPYIDVLSMVRKHVLLLIIFAANAVRADIIMIVINS